MRTRVARALAPHAPTVGAFILAAAIFVFATIESPSFASGKNIEQLLVFASFLGIAALGQFLVILGGGFDLSVPWLIGFGGVFLTRWTGDGMPDSVAIVLLLVCGGGIGLINGLGVTKLNISPIVMTLGIGGIVQGLLLFAGLDQSSQKDAPAIASSLAGDKIAGIPVLAFVWLLLALAAWWLLSRSSFGRRLYAVGMNEKAAWKAGVRVDRVRVLTYVISGVCSVFAGIVLSGYIGLSYVNMGAPYLFGSIAAVAVGGASVLGGRGTYWGTVAGALTLTFISALLPVLNISASALQIFYGTVIIIGVALSRYTASLVNRLSRVDETPGEAAVPVAEAPKS